MTNNQEWTFDGLQVASFELSKSERGTYPKYVLRVDGEVHYLKSKTSLCKWLSTIRSSISPDVYRNKGKSVTIDFDNE